MENGPKEGRSGLLKLLETLERQGASNAEITRKMDEYLSMGAREQGVPMHGAFELTPLCNLNCKMCYVHLSRAQLRARGKSLLTARQWKNIMAQAIDMGMLNATLTGGECLTYPDFDEVYLYLQKQGIELTVKSNGLLMTEERIDFFKEYPPTEIDISLYGADEDTYERVTGVRGFEAAMKGIRRVKEAGFGLHIGITPSKPMVPNIDALMALLDTMDVTFGVTSGLFAPREETGRSGMNLELSLDDYVHLYKLRAKMLHRELTPVCPADIRRPKCEGTPVKGLPCGAGKGSFAVHWDGMMYPCLSLETVSADVLNRPFREAWEKIHRAVLEYPYPGECVTCEYQPICTHCIVDHEAGGRPGHANPAYCERSMRLVAEGLVTRNE